MVARLAIRLLGGYTGDVAGAIEQLFESRCCWRSRRGGGEQMRRNPSYPPVK
jgi:hypothetical protein